MLIQSGPESEEGDALLAIATRAAIPEHMDLGLVQMKDQERMDRCSAIFFAYIAFAKGKNKEEMDLSSPFPLPNGSHRKRQSMTLCTAVHETLS